MKYFFVPGRKWILSLAELRSIISSSDIKNVELVSNKDFFIFDLMIDTKDAVKLFERLGGFIKFGFIVDEPYKYLEDNVLPDIQKNPKKVNFALSIYGYGSTRTKELLSRKHKLGLEIKRWFKQFGVKSRFVSNPRHTQTSTVLLKKNAVIEDGLELNLLCYPRKIKKLWGFTLSIQDFENFSKRDYGRPRSNRTKGMVPPKLARIMINLANIPDKGTIWDPFCGSGTILQEAMILGYKALGSDDDLEAIEESKENLGWISEEYRISHQNYSVFRHNITSPPPQKLTFDGIATEPYLGPIQRKTLTVEKINNIAESLTPIYTSLFKTAVQNRSKSRKKRIVLVVPGFRTDRDWIDMDLPFVTNFRLTEISSRFSEYPLQWDRPHSIIRRNIKIFEF